MLLRWQQEQSITSFLNFTPKTNSSQHTGTAILISTERQASIDLKAQIILKNRIQSLKLTHNQTTYLILNCYLPSGNSAYSIRNRVTTLNVMSNYLDKEKFDHLILAGDFNMVLQQIDKANHLIRHEDHHKLTAILESFSLFDSYRSIYPNNRCYSYARSNTASRLDRIYTSRSLSDSILNASYIPISFSDHYTSASLSFKLQISNPKMLTHWKLNNSLLQLSQYREQFIQWIKLWRAKEFFQHDPLRWWDSFKIFVKSYYSRVGKLHKQHNHERKQVLEQKLHSLNPTSDQSQIHQISLQLKSLSTHTHKGAQTRARPKLWLKDEDDSQNFLEMEKKKQQQQTIPTLTQVNNSTVACPPDHKTVHEHFTSKWGTPAPETNHESYLEDIKSFSDCTQPIDTSQVMIFENEISQAIQSFKDHTAPGLDGITIEFYKSFSKQLTPILCEIYNNIFLRKTLTSSQKHAYVKLLPKAGPSKDITNWRPVSLLNVDYKILAKILANRITPLLDDYISPNQQCGLPNRQMTNIHQNLLAVLEYAKDTHTPITFLQLDFSKAFDSLSHSFLFSVLHYANLPPPIITWIKIMLSDVDSQIQVNESKTPRIPLKKGVRQGCPLSMLLFILATDILSQKIRKNSNLPGMKLMKTEIKTQQYADDVTCILTEQDNIRDLKITLEQFSRHSGLTLNFSKCKYLSNSSYTLHNLDHHFPAASQVEELKILGIYFSLTNNASTKNWKIVITKLRKLAYEHQSETISIYGKILMINALFLPHVILLARIFFPTSRQINTISHIFYKFFWYPHYLEPMQRQKLSANHKEGGCNFPNPKAKIQAAFAMKLVSILQNNSPDMFYVKYAKYNLSYHLRRFNKDLYNRNSPHRWKPNSTWQTSLSILQTVTNNKNDWDNTTFRSLYWTIANPNPLALPKINASTTPKSWLYVFLRQPNPEFFSPKDKEIAFRVAPNAFLWGSFNTKLGHSSQHSQNLQNKCRLCKTNLDFPSHFFYDCSITRQLLSKLQKELSLQLNEPITLNKNLVLFNTSNHPKTTHVAATKLCSIFRKILLKYKTSWDKENCFVNKVDQFVHHASKKIYSLFQVEYKLTMNSFFGNK